MKRVAKLPHYFGIFLNLGYYHPGGGWGVGGDSHIKRTRLVIGNFKKNPRYQSHVLWARLEFFSPMRGTKYSKTTHLLSYSFGSTLEGTTKTPAVDLFKAENPKIYQIACGIPSATLFPGPFPWLGGFQGKGPRKEVVPSRPLGTISTAERDKL